MMFRFLFAVFVAFLFTAGGHYYLYERLVVPIFGEGNAFWQTTMLVLWSVTFFGFLILRIVPQLVRRAFETVMFFWMGSGFLLLVVCLLSAPFHWFFVQRNDDSRLLCYVVLCVGMALILYSMYRALKSAVVIDVSVPVPAHLGDDIENIKVVVLSDVHVSGLIGRRRIRKLVANVNALNPDVIFITGDLMDGSVRQLRREIEPFRDMQSVHGIFYITGNHEYYSGPNQWKDFFAQEFQWQVICNDAQVLKIGNVHLNILGIEDRHWLSVEKIHRRHDNRLQLAAESLAHQGGEYATAFNILLAHQPKDARILRHYPWIQLQISGHTHGGQMWPMHYLVKRDQKYLAGLYEIHPNQHIYVNQGTGFWGPPMRLGTVCEVTLMRFRRVAN